MINVTKYGNIKQTMGYGVITGTHFYVVQRKGTHRHLLKPIRQISNKEKGNIKELFEMVTTESISN